MQKLECQDLVNLGCVVPTSGEVAPDQGLEPATFQIRSRAAPRVEQHVAHVSGQDVAVPDAEVQRLVSAEEDAFGAQRRQHTIDPGQPLGHRVVVGVLRPERELEEPTPRGGRDA